ncbi:DNA polymerase I [Paracoccaceae bacterium]|nr:DNA polymerase I [Paracoccaceae bacterium]
MNNLDPGKHLVLVDGSGFIFRAYHALPPLKKSDGTPTGAVSGYCNMLFKLINEIKEFKATHIGVVFDHKDKTFRSDIYKAYKANRPPPPDDLVPQFQLIREATKAFGFFAIDKKGYEADDIIATLAQNATEEGAIVTIFSSDKDLMQLVSENIKMYDPIRNIFIDIERVKEKFGVTPDKVIDVQALIGDKVDNVPGVPGIGVKTASSLISEFKSVENLIEKYELINKNRIKSLISGNIDKIILSKKLVTLHKRVAIEINIGDLELATLNLEKLLVFTKLMELNTLSKRISSQLEEFNSSKPSKINKGELISSENYQVIQTEDELNSWCEKIIKQKFFAVDTETTSLDTLSAELVGVSICTGSGSACYIPMAHQTDQPEYKELEKKQLQRDIVLKRLRPLLADRSILKIGHNIKYDIKVLDKYACQVNSFDDTMLMSHCINGGSQRHSLDSVVKSLLDHETIKLKDLIGSGKKELSFKDVPISLAANYAAEDADMTFRVWEILKKELVKQSVYSVYQNIDKPMIPVLVKAELKGVEVDKLQLQQLSKFFEKKLKELENKIFKIVGLEFNIASPKQLSEILFEKLQLPNGKKNKSGGFQTGADILEDLSSEGFEIASHLLEWRKISKLKSTYSDSLMLHINNLTGRVHTSFNLAGTSTGRLSSSDPNLQNIPVRDAEGKKIREAFIAKKGAILLSLDYNQIELRLLAHIADVKGLKDAFKDNIDVHSSTASQIFKVPIEKVDNSLRRKAKAINFGIIYGISAFGLSKNLKISRSEAQEFIDNYFKQFPEIRDYMTATVKTAKEHGFVTTLFNRKIHLPNIGTKGPAGGFAERAAINAPIQGSASDIIKRAMIKIHAFLKSSKLDADLLLQVHDELIFETNKNTIDEIQNRASDIMEHATLPYLVLDVPLKVEGGIGINWYLAH